MASAGLPVSAAPASPAVLSSPTAAPLLMGEIHPLRSGLLAEDREYWLRLPASFAAHDMPAEVTVLYILDAEKLFPTAAAAAAFFESSRLSSLGPTVVVGVVSGDRTKDFTPGTSNARRDGTVDEQAKPVGGGAESFFHFLTTELRSAAEGHIPQQARVVRRILVGHSYAGLFTVHSLLWHPNAFDAYAAIDPSLWWDRGAVANRAARAGARTAKAPFPRIYVAFATAPRAENAYHLSRAALFRDEAVPLLEQQGIHVYMKDFPQEVHGSVAPPAIFDALKTLFPAELPKAAAAPAPAGG